MHQDQEGTATRTKEEAENGKGGRRQAHLVLQEEGTRAMHHLDRQPSSGAGDGQRAAHFGALFVIGSPHALFSPLRREQEWDMD